MADQSCLQGWNRFSFAKTCLSIHTYGKQKIKFHTNTKAIRLTVLDQLLTIREIRLQLWLMNLEWFERKQSLHTRYYRGKRSEVITVVKIHIVVIHVMNPVVWQVGNNFGECSASIFRVQTGCFGRTYCLAFHSEDRGRMFLQKPSTHLLHYIVSQPIRPQHVYYLGI
jgi:hypothetical protein